MSGCSFHDFAVADNFIGGGIGLTFLFGVGFSLGVGHICREGLLPDPPSQQKIHNKILIFSDPSPGVGVRVTCETTAALLNRPTGKKEIPLNGTLSNITGWSIIQRYFTRRCGHHFQCQLQPQ
jgi:hypothetical protein